MDKKTQFFTRAIGIATIAALALLSATGAVSCKDTLTEEIRENIRLSEIPEWTLTVADPTPANSGSVTPQAGAYTVTEGQAFAVSATPANHYLFINWNVASESGTATLADQTAQSTTVTLTGGNATVTPVFSTNPRTLTLTTDGFGATIPQAGPVTVADGIEYPINVTPSAGYTFDKWVLISGTAVFADANAASTTVTVSSGDAEIKATFKPGTYYVTLAAQTGGTVNPTGQQILTGGIAATIQATPGIEYNFKNWTANPAGAITFANPGSASTTIQAIGDASVTANFTLKTYSITLTSTAQGIAYFSGSTNTIQASSGQSVSIYASPNSGYQFKNWVKSGGTGVTSFANVNSSYTTVLVTQGNVTISPVFEAVTHTYSISTVGSYAPASSASPSFFTDAAISGNYLMLVGTAQNYDTSGIARSINISAANNMYSTAANFFILTGNPNSVTLDNAGNAYVSTETTIHNIAQSTAQYINSASYGASSLAWIDGILFALKNGTIRNINTATLALVDIISRRSTGYSLADIDRQVEQGTTYNPLSIYRIYPYLTPNRTPIAIGTATADNVAFTNLAQFSAERRQTYAMYRSEDDVTEGFGDMSGADRIGAMSANDDTTELCVLTNTGSYDTYLKFYNIENGIIYQGKVFILTTDEGTTEGGACFWGEGNYYALVGGMSSGTAKIWVIDTSSTTNPKLVYTKNLPGYAKVLWIGYSNGYYFAVVKKTVAGTDKLEIISFSFAAS